MKYLPAIAFLFVFSGLRAQTADDSVKQTINSLFVAMKNADTVLLRSVFAEGAILQTIKIDTSTGRASVKNEEVLGFLSSIAQLSPGMADERISFETVKTDADLASVWTPYRFYFNKEFSHCGVNSFQLARINGLWKIQYLIDTRRKTNCAENIK